MRGACKLENIPTILTVVAAAFERSDGCWLMHKRPQNKHHGGLWEFAGGKVEPGETPVSALIREISEELGIAVNAADVAPVAFAESKPDSNMVTIVILLYKVTRWTGEPAALEGEAVGWFTPSQIKNLDKPPLDCRLAESLFHDFRDCAQNEW